MNDILKTLKAIEAIESKKPLTESAVAECGDMGMAAPAPVEQGNPVTASITLNASGMNHVADLMRLLQQAGLEKAGPPAPAPMPVRADMERLRDKMAGLEGDPSAPKPQYFGVDDITGGGDDIHSKKAPEDIRVKDSSLADTIRDSEIEEWDNEPEEEYQDHNYMLDDLAGGINKPKKMYKPAAKGDNPMAVESIKDRLYKELSEKKAKPDYLDLDGDGDRKEPMKKAAKDAKKKKTNESDDADTAAQQALSISKIKRDSQKARHGINRKPGESLAAFIARADKLKKKKTNESLDPNTLIGQIRKRAKGVETNPDKRSHQQFAAEIESELIDLFQYYNQTARDTEKQEIVRGLIRQNKKAQQQADMRNANNIVSVLWDLMNTNEAEVSAPTHELDQTARQAMSVAQKIKRKINSGEQMDDRDYNQMAELGHILSRFGTNFGPKSMKDVMNHMKQYTDDRNEEGHGYPEFDVNRFKELIGMAKSTGESAVSEISPDLAKRYTKNAKVDRDNTDHILKRDGSTNDWKTNQELQKRNSKRTKGINRAAKRM